MIGLPWFLLAAGIGIVILGSFMAALSKPQVDDRPIIHSRMRNDEIVRNLNRTERIPLAGYVILLGMLCILVSIVWRLSRMFQ